MVNRPPKTIDTFTGVAFNYTDPDVNVVDVAHGLAHVCRFAGHVSRFYSVAEHSVLVSRLVRKMDPALALPALWHDGHEAYVGDMPKPLKAMVGPEYRRVARRIDKAITEILGLPVGSLKHPIIKSADNLAVVYEAHILKPEGGWGFTTVMHHEQAEDVVDWKIGLRPAAARRLFMETHAELT